MLRVRWFYRMLHLTHPTASVAIHLSSARWLLTFLARIFWNRFGIAGSVPFRKNPAGTTVCTKKKCVQTPHFRNFNHRWMSKIVPTRQNLLERTNCWAKLSQNASTLHLQVNLPSQSGMPRQRMEEELTQQGQASRHPHTRRFCAPKRLVRAYSLALILQRFHSLPYPTNWTKRAL